MAQSKLQGVMAALPTPMAGDGSLDVATVPALLDHAAQLGCHGALLAGSTGEGPSLSPEERGSLVAAAVGWRDRRPPSAPSFRLLAGSGAAALPTAIAATSACLAAGADAVVVQPPFYFPYPSDEGLVAWYARLVDAAVPPGSQLLLYDIPRVTGVPLSPELVKTLFTRFPQRVVGIKDSRADAEHAASLCELLPSGSVFTGHDALLAELLPLGAAGAITALAPLHGDLARAVWRAARAGDDVAAARERLGAVRAVLDGRPTVASVKAVLAARGLSVGPPRAPLGALSAAEGRRLSDMMHAAAV